MRDRLYVLWTHYSSHLLYIQLAIEAIRLESPELLENLPRWASITLLAITVVAKLIPQKPVAK
jgi:hypothetical protein